MVRKASILKIHKKLKISEIFYSNYSDDLIFYSMLLKDFQDFAVKKFSKLALQLKFQKF